MPVILDPELKTLMAQDQTVAVLWQEANRSQTALLAKAADEDVESFRGRVQIQTRWELGRFNSGSVLRLLLVIYDQPANPYRFETFINVASPEQLACVQQLTKQNTLALHFFDSRTEYVLTKQLNNPGQQRSQLRKLIGQAKKDRERLGTTWDFDLAKCLLQAHRPL